MPRGERMALNESDLAHLLRRTEIHSDDDKINALKNLATIGDAVDAILTRNINTKTTWPKGAPFFFDIPANNNWWVIQSNYRRWWINELSFSPAPLREKMTLFWHGHFTSDVSSSSFTQHMLSQNQLYRDMAFGDFRELAQKMAIEPLMMIYLNNEKNRKGGVNENFGRELLELFILGLNNYGLIPGQQFAYTQADVLAAAKAWSGHGLDYYPAIFPTYPIYTYRDNQHVDETLTFLGKTAKFQGPDIINHVLDTNPYRQISCRFIAAKLWAYFAYPNPEAGVIDSIVAKYQTTLNITDLLRAIFTHPNFYSDKAKYGLVSQPAEFVARIMKLQGIPMEDDQNKWAMYAMVDMSQELLSPPNVAGWKSNSYWLSTSSIGARGNVARNVFYTDRSKSIFRDLDTAAVSTTVTTAARRVGLVTLQAQTRKGLEDWVIKERSRSGSYPDFRSAGLFHLLVMSPDFQMS
jgi:uncharacterized protein (DUF1800 family)